MAKQDKQQAATTPAPAEGVAAPVDPTAPVAPAANAPTFAEPLPPELGGEQSFTEDALVRRATSLLADPSSFRFDISGLRPPFLSITHGVGALAQKFQPGDLVIGKDTCLLAASKDAVKPTINVVILNITEYLKEFNKDYRYSVILSTSTGGPIYNADPKLDITTVLLEGLNKKYAADKGKNKNALPAAPKTEETKPAK